MDSLDVAALTLVWALYDPVTFHLWPFCPKIALPVARTTEYSHQF